MEITTRPVSALKPDPTNARIHSERNIDAIAASMREFGQTRALVIREDGTVLAGNGALEAAKRLGLENLAVYVVPNDWSAEKAKAFALADNRTGELAEWDSGILDQQLADLGTGFDMTGFGFDMPNPYGTEETSHETAGGLGNPIISYEIIFDNSDQQDVWFEFLKHARALYPDAQTNAERIAKMLTDLLAEA